MIGSAAIDAAPPTGPVPTPSRRERERRCVVTGAVEPRDGLVRFVVGPDGAIVPDIDERLPGRGIWVEAKRDVLDKAVAKNAFARAAGARVAVPADLAERVASLLAARVIAQVAMARRAGAALAGFEKVQAALREGRAALLLEARDCGADAPRRIAGALGARPVLRTLAGFELASAFGRDVVVHVAIAPGRFAETIERECRRLAGFRPDAAGATDTELDRR